ncbi:MAG: hypothetical protein LIO90_07260 [Bacteroidales bacterium]|nr:hypothetical protein [Bacteroidales bacterium]
MKTIKIKLLAIVLIMAQTSIFWSCDSSSSEEQENVRVNIMLSRAEEEIVNNNVTFSLQLLSALDSTTNTNFIVSPLAAANNLVLFANGASGETLEQIINTLNGGNTDLGTINSLYQRILTTLPTMDNESKLNIYNSYGYCVEEWGDFTPTFSDALQSFDTEILPLYEDFNSMEEGIENWASKKSGKKVSFNNMWKDAYSILTNIVNFQGRWKEKFEEKDTKTKAFYGLTSTVNVPMMQNSSLDCWSGASTDFTWALIPFGNSSFSLILAMPEIGVAERGAQLLAHGSWEEASNLKHAKVNLSMPRFTLETDMDLTGALKAMGIEKAFDEGRAEFPLLYENKAERPYLTQMLQCSRIEVNEAGAKVVTVSSTGAGEYTDNIELIETVVIDHPFYFFIREQSTGLILFMGKVEDL